LVLAVVTSVALAATIKLDEGDAKVCTPTEPLLIVAVSFRFEFSATLAGLRANKRFPHFFHDCRRSVASLVDQDFVILAPAQFGKEK
jgi:stalled ribosome rescue protein Dom34